LRGIPVGYPEPSMNYRSFTQNFETLILLELVQVCPFLNTAYEIQGVSYGKQGSFYGIHKEKGKRG